MAKEISENEEIERVEPIRITDAETDKVYELDFSRESIRFAEVREFELDNVTKYPVTMIPEFWYLAFRKNHKNLSRKQTDDLLEKMGGLSPKVIERLVLLYQQAAFAHMVITDEDMEKNSKMTVEL